MGPEQHPANRYASAGPGCPTRRSAHGELAQIELTMVVAFFPGHLIRRIGEYEGILTVSGHDLAIVHIGDLHPLEQFGKAPQADDLAMCDGLPRDDAGIGEPEALHLRPTNDQAAKKGRYGKVHQVTGIPPSHPQVKQFLGSTAMVGMDIKQPVARSSDQKRSAARVVTVAAKWKPCWSFCVMGMFWS